MAPASGSGPSVPPDRSGVRVVDLDASYREGLGRRPALRGVSFRAPTGAVTAILGPNGAGKTTLFRVLLGFLRPDGGGATVDGLPPGRHRRRRGTGYLPEAGSLPRGWTVDGFLRRGLALSRPRERDVEGALVRARREAGLEGRGGQELGSLSRGLGRRALLAFALLGAPGLLLLDEPLAGLDPPGRAEVLRRFRALRGRGMTVLFASHDLEAVARVADRAVVLAGGRVTRTVEGLARDSRGPTRLRAAFVGLEGPG